MINSLSYTQLYNTCDTKQFSFKTTHELEPLAHPLGQDNVLEAVDFGTSIQQDGYNIFAMGPSGGGKHSTVMKFLKNKASKKEPANDWCYVNNFKNSHKPIAIELPPGKAGEFKEDINELIELLKVIIPALFETNNYRTERDVISKKFTDAQNQVFSDLHKEAAKSNVSISSLSNNRVTFVPIVEGKVLSPEEFRALEGDNKKELNQRMRDFELVVKDELQKVRELNKVQQKEFKELDRKITKEAVESVIDEVREKYKDHEKILKYLDGLEENVVKHFQDFITKAEDVNLPAFMKQFYAPSFDRYRVNLFVSHEENDHAPVIYEDNPIHQNLIGKVEHLSQIGTLVTDFTMIKPGALHKASGGFLLVDARKLLMKPFAYEELKRALQSKEIRIESLAEQYSFISTTSLEPEPIPIDVKVVLVGERILYYLLYHYDPDFKELFKVSADFEDEMPRNDKNLQLYARMIGGISKHHKLLPLTPKAVARVIEKSSRDVSHSLKFSTHLLTIADLLKEADYWAQKGKSKSIGKKDIEKALYTQVQRINRIQRKLYDQIDEGTIMINLEGEAEGQINALSYISIGGHDFGLPSRVTARTRIGKGDIINIERKVELSGPIHSKGVMIMSSYLGSKYASDIPLSLSASLAFEQSYGMVEGDSASSTELYALLSSLSGVPIKQNIAVTGSVNQFGEVQPIGGVNEKIEGFFDICMRKDPKLSYGVMIPQANIKHLMLKKEVIDAVKAGKFTIYAVSSIDEGIEILTGVEAGKQDEAGDFPANSINALVVARLEEFFQKVKEFNNSNKDDE